MIIYHFLRVHSFLIFTWNSPLSHSFALLFSCGEYTWVLMFISSELSSWGVVRGWFCPRGFQGHGCYSSPTAELWWGTGQRSWARGFVCPCGHRRWRWSCFCPTALPGQSWEAQTQPELALVAPARCRHSLPHHWCKSAARRDEHGLVPAPLPTPMWKVAALMLAGPHKQRDKTISFLSLPLLLPEAHFCSSWLLLTPSFPALWQPCGFTMAKPQKSSPQVTIYYKQTVGL